MAAPALHRFAHDGRNFALDTETCFCFEADAISWDVIEHFPQVPANRILHLLETKHLRTELEEVLGELEWLRATGAILPARSITDLEKQFAVDAGLRRVDCAWGPEVAAAGLDILLARAGTQQALALHLHLPEQTSAELCTSFVLDALRRGRLAAKTLRVIIHLPIVIEGGGGEVAVEFRDGAEVTKTLRAIGIASRLRLAALVKICSDAGPETRGWFRIVPVDASFGDAVATLRKAGAGVIEIDLDAAFAQDATLDPTTLLGALRAVADGYARDLLAGRYYRLEPVAGLFHRIYQGTAQPRADGVGTHELALDAAGGIYPSRYWNGAPAHKVGDIRDGIDDAALQPFGNVGARTTADCLACWARNLCGGGTAAVHETRSGSYRQPDPRWCDAQRTWTEAAVAAFSTLSAAGVDFNRVYQNLGRATKPSFFQLARAAFRQQVGMRPLAEADAPLLQKWGNWNEAAYFTFNESGVLMATEYDREMDSLHPRGYEHEFMIVQKNGTPIGLFRVRPELPPGTATAYFWLRDSAGYADKAIQRSFREILSEAAGQQAIRRLLTPVSSFDAGLPIFLESIGFNPVGTQREALYLHGTYHDVDIYAATLS